MRLFKVSIVTACVECQHLREMSTAFVEDQLMKKTEQRGQAMMRSDFGDRNSKGLCQWIFSER